MHFIGRFCLKKELKGINFSGKGEENLQVFFLNNSYKNNCKLTDNKHGIDWG